MPSVTRPVAATGSEHRAEVERRVLAAVEGLLAGGESFTALPVGRIAAEAGIGRTTFYGHFRDKPTLLIRLTDSATTALFDVARSWVEDDGSTLEGLETTLERLVAEYRDHAPLLRALTELATYEPEVEEFWRETVDGFAEIIQRRLERDAAAGRVAEGFDAATTAAWIAWGTERTIAVHVAASADGSGDDALAHGIAAATWAAMRRS